MSAEGRNKTGHKSGQSRTRKSKAVRLGSAALAGVCAAAGYHAVAATATLPIIARLVRAIEITVNTTLDFGTLAMTVDRAGAATIDPGVNRLFIDDGGLSLAGGKPAAGRIMVKGAEFPVAISLEHQTVKLTNGTGTVVIDNFNLVTAKGGTKMTFTPAGENTYAFTVPVGATIRTKQGQLSGTYVGTNRVFASYQ